jgi:hypothetical protein
MGSERWDGGNGNLGGPPRSGGLRRAPDRPRLITAFTEGIQDRFGVLHYAYLPVFGYPVACAPSPCGRLSRPPWCGVNRTTAMGTP